MAIISTREYLICGGTISIDVLETFLGAQARSKESQIKDFSSQPLKGFKKSSTIVKRRRGRKRESRRGGGKRRGREGRKEKKRQ